MSEKTFPIEKSTISVMLLGGILSVAGLTLWRVSAWATRIESRLEGIERELLRNRWTDTDMRRWALDLQASNPTIHVPSVLAEVHGGGG